MRNRPTLTTEETKMLEEFKDLCEEVLRIITKPGNMYDAEEIRIQILYILSNLIE